MTRGFTIRQVGIGDGVQFTSLPENYFRATGQRLVDISKSWYLDFNPYVDRETKPDEVKELWNYPTQYPWPKIRDTVYMSNAEIHASVFGVRNPPLIRPRLYRFEDFPFENRQLILFHPFGKSHVALPDYIIEHVVKKYSPTGRLIQIGLPSDPGIGIPKMETPDMWSLVKAISECQLFIGIDSGPSWIAACYPDITIKKIRVNFQYGYCEPKDWVPLDVKNSHSFWDDRMFQMYNTFDDDVGFTLSWRKL
jgi:hypothetical protein